MPLILTPAPQAQQGNRLFPAGAVTIPTTAASSARPLLGPQQRPLSSPGTPPSCYVFPIFLILTAPESLQARHDSPLLPFGVWTHYSPGSTALWLLSVSFPGSAVSEQLLTDRILYDLILGPLLIPYSLPGQSHPPLVWVTTIHPNMIC